MPQDARRLKPKHGGLREGRGAVGEGEGGRGGEGEKEEEEEEHKGGG